MTAAVTAAVLGGAIFLVFCYITLWFAVALATRRNDLADIAWGLGFIAIAAWLLLRDDAPLSTRQFVMSALVAAWGLRLAYHIYKRNLRPGHGEDKRYAAWRRQWGRWFVPRTYLQVFMLQGLFMLIISTPVLVVGSVPDSQLGALDVLGITIWVGGFAFQSVGDAQLARFLRNPSNRGRIMDRGLWAWTRHPNYFGEATMWWGLAVIALSVPGGWIGILGPVTITWLLTKVSGIPLLEPKMALKPGWEEYAARTSAFLPRPPRNR